MAALVQRLPDRRGRRVVFLAHCLLNENTRYLGGAGRAGCVREVVEGCLAAGLGIVQLPCPEQRAWGGVQLPCPEQRAWGGVLKRHLLLAYGLKHRHPLAYRLRRLLWPLALFFTRRVYRRLARQVAGEIADYVASGFAVVAVAGVDGSPTCGVQTTLTPDALEPILAAPGACLTVEGQNAHLRRAAREGRGLFIEELQRELARRRLVVPFLAHDLYAELDGQPSRVHPVAVAHGHAGGGQPTRKER